MTRPPRKTKQPAPMPCLGIFFRGQLIRDAAGTELPGFTAAARACTDALVAPRLTPGEAGHAAD